MQFTSSKQHSIHLPEHLIDLIDWQVILNGHNACASLRDPVGIDSVKTGSLMI
jgi:hypothetical protein